MQVNAFILQGAPKTLDEDTDRAPALAIYPDMGADPFLQFGTGEGCEQATLKRVYDLWQADAMDCRVQHLDAEVRLGLVGDTLGE